MLNENFFKNNVRTRTGWQKQKGKEKADDKVSGSALMFTRTKGEKRRTMPNEGSKKITIQTKTLFFTTRHNKLQFIPKVVFIIIIIPSQNYAVSAKRNSLQKYTSPCCLFTSHRNENSKVVLARRAYILRYCKAQIKGKIAWNAISSGLWLI